jgi:FdhD protein
MSEIPQPNEVLDTKEAVCPLPVLLTREAIKNLKTGQILKIVTRDPAAKTDIPIWAGRMGNETIHIEETGERLTIYIRKGTGGLSSARNEGTQLSSKLVSHLRLQLNGGAPRRVKSGVALEIPVHIRVNGRDLVTIMATPNHFEDLAVGYLLDERIVDGVEQIHRLEEWGNIVSVETDGDIDGRLAAAEKIELITNECISLDHYLQMTETSEIPSVRTGYRINAQEVGRMVGEFNLSGKDEKPLGGIHSAALFEDGRMKQHVLDVSRHSAVDKVFGASARDHTDFAHSVIITSGRQSAGMVLKAARMNVPIAVSMRGPIYSGVLAAQKTNITLLCYATANRFDIYSGEDRILTV